jgi:predicted ribosome quality control (RQC) complex YloA/Tae2 family protein
MDELMRRAVSELKQLLIGARIDRIQQMDRGTFVFAVYSRGKNRQLVVSLRKNAARFHLVFGRIHKSSLFSSAPAEVLKKYLGGGRVSGVDLGNRSVALLLPTVSVAFDFSTSNFTLRDAGGRFLYSMNPDASSAPDSAAGEEDGEGAGSLEVNRLLSRQFFSERGRLMKKRLLRVLRTEEKKQIRLGRKLGVEREESERRERYRKIGELMKYHLAEIPKGSGLAVLRDFEGQEVRVELDPGLGAKENMNAYFNKYRTLKKRSQIIGQRIAEQEEKLQQVQELIAGIQAVPDDEAAALLPPLLGTAAGGALGSRLLQRLGEAGRAHSGTGEERKRGYLVFRSRSGKSIFVGRNAQENDYVTSRLARGNDLWFHVESAGGGHVILRYEKAGEYLEEDIVDASQLALHFSALRRQGSGTVVYTRRKYVTKPKGAAAGNVVYHGEKSRWTRAEEELIQTLLDSSR